MIKKYPGCSLFGEDTHTYLKYRDDDPDTADKIRYMQHVVGNWHNFFRNDGSRLFDTRFYYYDGDLRYIGSERKVPKAWVEHFYDYHDKNGVPKYDPAKEYYSGDGCVRTIILDAFDKNGNMKRSVESDGAIFYGMFFAMPAYCVLGWPGAIGSLVLGLIGWYKPYRRWFGDRNQLVKRK